MIGAHGTATGPRTAIVAGIGLEAGTAIARGTATEAARGVDGPIRGTVTGGTIVGTTTGETTTATIGKTIAATTAIFSTWGVITRLMGTGMSASRSAFSLSRCSSRRTIGSATPDTTGCRRPLLEPAGSVIMTTCCWWT